MSLEPDRVEALLGACRGAGELICAQTREASARKADGSPVSVADQMASAYLGERLAQIDPGVPVICEEGVQRSHGAATFWLVDPLDGTREFLRGGDRFTVNIARIEDGQAVFGVVHAPARGLSYWGGRGLGAWRNGVAIRARTLASVGAAPRILISPADRQSLESWFGAALEHAFAQPQIEELSGALKFCQLAEGQADLYPRWWPSCGWDSAAGQAVLEAAGGAVYGPGWQALRYRESAGWYNPRFIAVADATADWRGVFGGRDLDA